MNRTSQPTPPPPSPVRGHAGRVRASELLWGSGSTSGVAARDRDEPPTRPCDVPFFASPSDR